MAFADDRAARVVTVGAGLPRPWASSRHADLALRLARVSALQALVQLAAFATGILVIRGLTKREYALFAMATAVQTTFSILTDSGMTIAVTATGGVVWDDRRRLGQLVNAGLLWRRRVGWLWGLAIMPLLAILLRRQDAEWTTTVVVVVAVLVSVSVQLHTHVIATALRLRSRIFALQTAELAGACVRIAVIALLFLVWRNAAIAVLGAAAGIAVQAYLVSRRAEVELDRSQPIDPSDTRHIKGIVKTQFANTVFYCIQGQITLWLIALFGSTDKVADVAGLGRLAIVMIVVASLLTNVAVPAFARCRERGRLQLLYAQVVGAYVLLVAGLTIVTAAFPRQILFVLGPNYRNLQHELVIIAATTGLGALVDAMWSLNTARAWVRHSWVSIPLLIGTQCVLAFCLDLSTVSGVLWFGLWSTVPQLAVNAWLSARGFAQLRRVTTS